MRWTWLVLIAGCAEDGDVAPEGEEPSTCEHCDDPAYRHQPEEPVDEDNVVGEGATLTALELPAAPTSGFRIVAPPIELAPGEERQTCVAWPIPELRHPFVYASRLYTTQGLHHSNVLAFPVSEEDGESPYPDCLPGAEDPLQNLDGRTVPDILFANSTQVVGGESVVFPEGLAYRLDPAREIVASVHVLNPTGETLRVEIAYDFFTMPEEDLEHEVAPMAFFIREFLVPPGVEEVVSTSCQVFGGNLVSLMPHTHQYATAFDVELRRGGAAVQSIYEGGAYDLESDIEVFDPIISLEGIDEIAFSCTFRNTTDHDLVYGSGDNEMCVLFGYQYPVETQTFGAVIWDGGPCYSLQVGLGR